MLPRILLNLDSDPAPPALLPLTPSESLQTALFLAVLDGVRGRPDQWGCPGAACPLLYAGLLHGLPILIRFAAEAICPSSVINPGCYLAPTGHTVNPVFVYVCVCVSLHGCAFHTLILRRHSFKDLLRHQKMLLV